MSWLVLSLICLCLYGVWGFLSKFVSAELSAPSLLIYSLLGSALGIPLYVLTYRNSFSFEWENGWTYLGILVGLFASFGAFFFFNAISQGEASKVVVITSLYPVFTTILAFLFLNETISFGKIIGILLCLTGIIILSYAK
ncbi:MAG: EamA family transporter [Cyanobacteria bacterium]|jgi:transporter family protein|nr:EamA family transporter [Cyanobacteria bacterium GSL.Bin21]